MIEILQIPAEAAEQLCRKITQNLPEYFGLPEANEHYAIGVRSRLNLAAKFGNDFVGLISIDFPYPNNSNIYWMAVRRDFQSTGIGKKLIAAASELVTERGATTMTVETLAPSEADENYLKTYQFYQANSFNPLLNLKPQAYEWHMVYMVKNLPFTAPPNKINSSLSIRHCTLSDIDTIVSCFAQANWIKPRSIFEDYLSEQKNGDRLMWAAYMNEQFAGYVTLKWQSQYMPFTEKKIPEIMDLNVLPPFRNCGVGSKLLETAEKASQTKSNIVGLGVGLYAGHDGGYGPAQKLYVKRGYIPDGNGVTYSYEKVTPGEKISLDDDLVLWFTKNLF